jgi:predicted aldo/keto reductase-like oxidoreductase
MTDQELKDLNLTGQLSEPGLYCHQCKICLNDCPNDIDIPTIMRSFMYAYGYKNLKQAWQTMANVEYSSQCENCTSCVVKCTAGFDLKKKISDIARLRMIPSDIIQV